jgi:hypothetical protein
VRDKVDGEGGGERKGFKRCEEKKRKEKSLEEVI